MMWKKAIEAMMRQSMDCVESAQLGRASRINDAAGRYIEFCKSTFPSNLSLENYKIVVDCANGATYHIAPNVMRELGAEVIGKLVVIRTVSILMKNVVPTRILKRCKIRY